jgi:hypothetical protein|tara:strand:+ start:60 stop:338 length:279 start_codon:yes stop_codon:yes gene_type:complete
MNTIELRFSVKHGEKFLKKDIVVNTASADSNVLEMQKELKHDHGGFLPLKSSGHIADLINAIATAKAGSDQYLTELINESEKEQTEDRKRKA